MFFLVSKIDYDDEQNKPLVVSIFLGIYEGVLMWWRC